MQRKRYVLAGSGSRGLGMFAQPLMRDFQQTAELVGLFDHNPLRLEAARGLLEAPTLPVFTDFDAMLAELDPDAVIIATKDSTHAEFMVRTFQAGKRAIAEKPVCVDAVQCRSILEALARNRGQGASGLVTHNMRYGAVAGRIRDLLRQGAIGELFCMHFVEMLDRRHGADYFRRWHRRKENSGGLLIHKASHHFDLLNWFAGSRPARLSAGGGLFFYGARGGPRGERCLGCEHARACDFHVDMFQNERSRRLYHDAESADGYRRDGCVFAEEIDIEDHASVIYTCENGVQVTYALTAFSPYEGMEIVLEGSAGRIEYRARHDTKWAPGTVTVHGLETVAAESLRLFPAGGTMQEIEVERLEGSHGGADPVLRADFFARDWEEPATECMATVAEAVQAVLVGAAANISIAEDSRPVRVQELLAG